MANRFEVEVMVKMTLDADDIVDAVSLSSALASTREDWADHQHAEVQSVEFLAVRKL